MRVYFRNFPEIDREKFINKELYENSVRKQKQEIVAYKMKMKKIFNIIGISVAGLIALILIILFIKFIGKLFSPDPDFTVQDTVLNERSVELDEVKLYNQDDIKITSEITVCIDPGHGGEELGETLTDDSGEIVRSEKYDNMELALLLKEKLEKFGFNVIMTRTGDTKHINSDRSTFANENNADLFISLHRNNLPSDKSKKGVEIYVPTRANDSSELSYTTGENILQYLDASGISENGGTHFGSITSESYDFQINRETNMSSVLIELGYISNEEDNILYDLNIERYATAISYGVLKTYAPECIEFDTEPAGQKLKNGLVIDYESLSDEEIHYSVNSDKSNDYSSLLYEVQSFDERYDDLSADFIRFNDNNEIYLTFDVGTDAGNVKAILETLNSHSAKAVFFINYTFAVNHPDLMNMIIEGGHMLGNGTKDFYTEGICSLDEEFQLEQIIDLHEYVLYNYNYCMSLFRFPNGIFSEKLLAIVNNYQYQSIFWSYSYNDYTSLGFQKEDILKSMEDSLNNGIIYVLRTDSETDLMVLDSFLNTVSDKNYNVGKLVDAD